MESFRGATHVHRARHGYPHRASADLWRRHTVRGATHVHRADTGTHTGPRPTCGDGTPSEAPHTYTGQTRVPTPGLGRPVGTAHHQRRHTRTQGRHGYPHRASADLWRRHTLRGAIHVHRARHGYPHRASANLWRRYTIRLTTHHQTRHTRTQGRHGYPHRASADLWRRYTIRGATHAQSHAGSVVHGDIQR